ncbi:MAG: hypothetical protein ACPHL9_09100, partial [Limisphaerales bacterium]
HQRHWHHRFNPGRTHRDNHPLASAWPSPAQSHRPQFPGFPEQLGGAVSGSPPVAAKTDSSFFIRREPQCGQFGALDSLLERIRCSLVLRHFLQVYSKRGIGGGR